MTNELNSFISRDMEKENCDRRANISKKGRFVISWNGNIKFVQSFDVVHTHKIYLRVHSVPDLSMFTSVLEEKFHHLIISSHGLLCMWGELSKRKSNFHPSSHLPLARRTSRHNPLSLTFSRNIYICIWNYSSLHVMSANVTCINVSEGGMKNKKAKFPF